MSRIITEITLVLLALGAITLALTYMENPQKPNPTLSAPVAKPGEVSCVPAGKDDKGFIIKCSDGRVLHGL